MRVLYSDGRLMRGGGRVHLVHLSSGWHVLGIGYLCAVCDGEEATSLFADLKKCARQHGAAITAPSAACLGLEHQLRPLGSDERTGTTE